MGIIGTLFIAVTYFVVIVYVISGLDDVLLDLYFWGTSLRRRWVGRKYPRLTLEWLEAREQQPIAVLVPAWQERDVIGQMLRHACAAVRYRNFEIFVGTYRNDPETQEEVDRVAREFPRVHKIVVAADGPTTKAHNLNATFDGVVAYEAETGRRFEIIVNHDAEDIIHPLSLLLYNYLIPRKDMIQLPVFPAAVPPWNFTYWTYADEFAENHTKDLLVRERMGGFVPSAGVGTAFTRRAFELIGLLSAGEIFSTGSLTEDYLFGLRMYLEGLQSAFVLQRVEAVDPGRAGVRRTFPWIATQALFPRGPGRAIRQKTRWVLGIALQTWATTGWPGAFMVRWNLLRDRKILLTHVAGFLGYWLALIALLYALTGGRIFPDYAPLITPRSPLWYLIIAASVFMLWRIFYRALAVYRIYGTGPALLSIPRTVWGNAINFLAVVRALRQFYRSRHGEEMAWEKTEHEFPGSTAAEAAESEPSPSSSVERTGAEPAAIPLDLETALRSLDPGVRLRAVGRIPLDRGGELLPAVLALLRDDVWTVRAEACRSLSFFRFPDTAGALQGAATDPVWTVRANAVKALAKLGDAGEAALLALLAGGDRYARELAMGMLEQGGFCARNLARLQSRDPEEAQAGRTFFDAMEKYGPSRLARETLSHSVAGAVA